MGTAPRCSHYTQSMRAVKPMQPPACYFFTPYLKPTSSSTPTSVPMTAAATRSSLSGPQIWSLAILALAIALVFSLSLPAAPPDMADDLPASIYDIAVKDIKGNDVKLGEYAGKVLIIINVASKCGLTNSNYKELNVLYEKYKQKGLEILAFPCNQFAGQEPGSNEEIQETVCTRFKAEFPIFDKVDVNGKEAAPLYKYLKSQKGGFLSDGIKWNFTKFLVNKDGKVVERYAPTTSPLRIENDIQKLLGTS